MPVRARVVEKMLRAAGNAMSFNNVDMTAKVNGKVYQPMDEQYELVIDAIDWNRVLLEATARHIALDHEDDDYTGMLCPECVCEALLATGTMPEWKRRPKVPRIKGGRRLGYCPRDTPGCVYADCSGAPGKACYGPDAPRHVDMGP